MTKLQRYNNIVFALFGTIGIIIGIFGLIEIVKQSGLFTFNNFAVIASQEIDKTADKNQIRQILDLNMPIILDTTNNLCIYPISQKTLSKPANRDELYTDFMEKIPTGSIKPQVMLSTKISYGDYNNFIVAKNLNVNCNLVFDFKVSVNRLDFLDIPDQPLLLMAGTRKDSNNDKLLTSEDLQTLFIYDVNMNHLLNVALDNSSVIEYRFVSSLDLLIIKFGIDKNNNGIFEYESEPTTLKTYSFKNNEIKSTMNEKILQNALDILNGKQQDKE